MPPDPGLATLPERMLAFEVLVPPRPFEPWGRVDAWSEWTWCTALGGFVFRLRTHSLRFVTADGSERFPPMPLTFLDAVDRSEGAIGLGGTDGGLHFVPTEDLLERRLDTLDARVGVVPIAHTAPRSFR